MALDHTVIRRLAFIKFLYQTSVAQSHEPAPHNCASLLTVHDAVELFLQLASEHLNAGSSKPDFMDYWDLLNKKLAPGELDQKESMRRLNKARVALKHHGTFPSSLDVESFRASATAFFEANTPTVFGCSLGEVSLVEFVNPETARERLKEAAAQLKNGDKQIAIKEIVIAFHEMIDDYEQRKQTRRRSSPFEFGGGTRFGSGFVSQLEGPLRGLGGFVKDVSQSIEALQQAIKILSLGIDYRRYSRFKMLAPSAYRTGIGGYSVIFHNPPLDEGEVGFCFDFVVETGLTLAEFDYTIPVTR